MVELGVNIDHVATLRQARKTYEPDPVWAAAEAELAGADGITIHLREDRRHITDRDVELLRKTVQCKLNLEMSLVQEIVKIAIGTRPHQATLVPERRQEVTTEGGLDLTSARNCADAVKKLHDVGVFVSAFLDADPRQIDMARDLGFDAVELHTGQYANADERGQARELARLTESGKLIISSGMRLHAGHGLNYRNVLPVASIEGMHELNIGHSIISRSVFVGLQAAVREMKQLINKR
jgi:pyridoxine 5-phosphate synthase